jgi:hypothetical protein
MGQLNDVAFSPNGQQLVSVGFPGSVHVGETLISLNGGASSRSGTYLLRHGSIRHAVLPIAT